MSQERSNNIGKSLAFFLGSAVINFFAVKFLEPKADAFIASLNLHDSAAIALISFALMTGYVVAYSAIFLSLFRIMNGKGDDGTYFHLNFILLAFAASAFGEYFGIVPVRTTSLLLAFLPVVSMGAFLFHAFVVPHDIPQEEPGVQKEGIIRHIFRVSDKFLAKLFAPGLGAPKEEVKETDLGSQVLPQSRHIDEFAALEQRPYQNQQARKEMPSPDELRKALDGNGHIDTQEETEQVYEAAPKIKPFENKFSSPNWKPIVPEDGVDTDNRSHAEDDELEEQGIIALPEDESTPQERNERRIEEIGTKTENLPKMMELVEFDGMADDEIKKSVLEMLSSEDNSPITPETDYIALPPEDDNLESEAKEIASVSEEENGMPNAAIDFSTYYAKGFSSPSDMETLQKLIAQV